jgi:hypothetical protein
LFVAKGGARFSSLVAAMGVWNKRLVKEGPWSKVREGMLKTIVRVCASARKVEPELTCDLLQLLHIDYVNSMHLDE